MQKRTALALATIHNPELLILDEPFSGLDLYHTKILQSYLLERKKNKMSTLISSHIMPYIIELCDYVYIFKNQKIKKIEEWNYSNQIERKKIIDQII